MNIKDILIEIDSLSVSDTIHSALSLMLAGSVDVIPIQDSQKCLIGAVTRDNLLRVLQSGATANDVLEKHMSENPGYVSTDSDIAEIPLSSIPAVVVDQGGKYAGVVTLESYAAALRSAHKESRDQFSSILDSAETGLIAINANGIIVEFNRMAEDLLGIMADESKGRPILDVIPNTRLMEIMKSGKLLTGQKFQGHKLMLLVNYAPIIRESKVVGAVSVFQALSRLEDISHELSVVKGLNRELEAIIHSSYDGIWITDYEGRVLDINEAYERITGIKAKEVIGRTMQELVDEGYFDQSVTVLVMKELRSITINQTVRGKKQILVTGNPIFDDRGKLFRVVTNVRDVSELVSLREQLTMEKEQALKYKTELTHLRSMRIRDSELIFRSGLMTQIVELAIKVAEWILPSHHRRVGDRQGGYRQVHSQARQRRYESLY